ncbi:MAG: hypothetical protein A3B91_04970 [Candidatus Yanofskybacteria bacterium RIFCSPHIGHO2_02_FULL_41_29]|uniref:Uncharacterized protein n=1 Tax=Candidatus Yanofskybacteria bacterium RIFCSPHIGHO2_01_FULL_41_53 TaxID=1802663 RepID=A0A1F8EH35_9BACT|nr:MAG: hypothetical protein A2650_01580 [Candidatus Yanofskybacteria bacterium RIFCSPHIGHO2_01_FULL_41_53]OGN11170.1 MAG: hypothetical protein A3B91_04970 [Candidatus Yanofskybacteria bacterium RIFCSPHIGHO2_02_FULL_41_29]OGN22083.1 MAG: hypothetical protein A2916_00185 [Candidatus Yanofskybacteria bacterium RIFCSPLOWO2_01_FULL_41_67]OGN28537.1 MAG: hypothetical protein A3H54_04750 [Candidatus Yanofskybacteria bacterium RIFCSPLOWO2_02_FULL_41_13]OGN34582.1 MAG: hypothetical protein A3F98_02260 
MAGKTVKKIRIVNYDGRLMIYGGKPMIFDIDEKERAERTLEFIGQQYVTSGPLRLEEYDYQAP